MLQFRVADVAFYLPPGRFNIKYPVHKIFKFMQVAGRQSAVNIVQQVQRQAPLIGQRAVCFRVVAPQDVAAVLPAKQVHQIVEIVRQRCEVGKQMPFLPAACPPVQQAKYDAQVGSAVEIVFQSPFFPRMQCFGVGQGQVMQGAGTEIARCPGKPQRQPDGGVSELIPVSDLCEHSILRV